jgi:hypothetical protein
MLIASSGGGLMATAAPYPALQIGELVRHRSDPVDTPRVGVVGGFVFLREPPLVVVRWPRASSTFEPENTLAKVHRLRR